MSYSVERLISLLSLQSIHVVVARLNLLSRFEFVMIAHHFFKLLYHVCGYLIPEQAASVHFSLVMLGLLLLHVTEHLCKIASSARWSVMSAT